MSVLLSCSDEHPDSYMEDIPYSDTDYEKGEKPETDKQEKKNDEKIPKMGEGEIIWDDAVKNKDGNDEKCVNPPEITHRVILDINTCLFLVTFFLCQYLLILFITNDPAWFKKEKAPTIVSTFLY